jgi:hypothetical protein
MRSLTHSADRSRFVAGVYSYSGDMGGCVAA